jgi:hypothetical protein
MYTLYLSGGLDVSETWRSLCACLWMWVRGTMATVNSQLLYNGVDGWVGRYECVCVYACVCANAASKKHAHGTPQFSDYHLPRYQQYFLMYLAGQISRACGCALRPTLANSLSIWWIRMHMVMLKSGSFSV